MSRSSLLRSVADHLAKQRRRAVTDTATSCEYKAESGAMCAIGGILPPEMYHPRMEGIGIGVMFGMSADNTPNHSNAPGWPQAALDVVAYLCNQMPEIGNVDEKRLILATVQRYHDATSSCHSYNDALFEFGYLPDSQLSDMIYRDLVFLTDKTRADAFNRQDIET